MHELLEINILDISWMDKTGNNVISTNNISSSELTCNYRVISPIMAAVTLSQVNWSPVSNSGEWDLCFFTNHNSLLLTEASHCSQPFSLEGFYKLSVTHSKEINN